MDTSLRMANLFGEVPESIYNFNRVKFLSSPPQPHLFRNSIKLSLIKIP